MPIHNGKYINPGWVNNGPPAIDAAELNAISDTLENLDAGGGSGGNGKRYARFVIGTSTNGWTAADCDYLCDGVDDEAEINAAAQAIPSSGGKIVLLDGTYNITTYVSLKMKTTLEGTGRTAVLLKRAGTNGSNVVRAILTLPNGCEVRNISVDGGEELFGSGDWGMVADVLASAGSLVNNITIYNSVNDCLYLEPITGRSIVVNECDFSGKNAAIHIDCAGEVIISDCSDFGSNYLIRAYGINQTPSGEEPLQRPLTVKATNFISVAGLGRILLDGTGFSTITNCICSSITIQMTQAESELVKPERGRHILMGNHCLPTNDDLVLTIGENVNNCIAIGNIFTSGDMVGRVVDNGENNIISNGTSGGQVTLTTSGWSSNQQTVTAPGVTTSNYVNTGPTPATFITAMEAGVYCSGQGNGTLTFTCTTTPSSPITYTYTAQEVL